MNKFTGKNDNEIITDGFVIFDKQNNHMVTGKKFYKKKEVVAIDLARYIEHALVFPDLETAEAELKILTEIGYDSLEIKPVD